MFIAATQLVNMILACIPMAVVVIADGAGAAGAASAGSEFMNAVLKYASMAVTGFGGAIAMSGLLNIGEGKSQQNAAKQDEGVTKIVGGAIIIVVGIGLVPQLSSLLSI